MYADIPERLEPQLRQRLRAARTTAPKVVDLRVSPLTAGVTLDNYCRLRPEFLPFDGSLGTENLLPLGALGSDVPMDVLLKFHIPPLRFDEAQGLCDVV